jgi:beta-lactamase regulating signal transducer with metallopeptidase domain
MNMPTLGFWLVHAGGLLVSGALAWGLGSMLHRSLRISHAAHGYWLALWMLALLPGIAGLALDLWTPASLAALPDALSSTSLPLDVPAPLQTMGERNAASPSVQALVMGSAREWQGVSIPMLLAALYLATVAVALLKHLRDARLVRRVVNAGTPIASSAWPGPASARQAQSLERGGVQIRLAHTSTTPFAVSWPRPSIILPGFALEQFNDRQLRLILRHEAAHLLHRDPQRAAAMRLLSALFWFDPFLRVLGRRVQMAAELRCDAWALAVDSTASRQFAGAYVQTLRLSAGQAPMLTALAGQRMQAHRLRIRQMLEGDPDRPLPRWLGRLLGGLALATAGALSLGQFALAHGDPHASAAIAKEAESQPPNQPANRARLLPASQVHTQSTSHVQPRSEAGLVTPVQGARISSRFGAESRLRSHPHRGTDFAGRRGTPVHAVADGQVITATTQLPGNPDYGTVVVIDHGAGRHSLYAHLDSIAVQVGQRVDAGSAIGRMGTTGKATGPHLHLELLEHGQRIDPEPHLR